MAGGSFTRQRVAGGFGVGRRAGDFEGGIHLSFFARRACLAFRSLRAGRAYRTLWTGVAFVALRTLRASLALWTLWTCCTSGACRADVAFFAFRPLRSGISLRTSRACITLFALEISRSDAILKLFQFFRRRCSTTGRCAFFAFGLFHRLPGLFGTFPGVCTDFFHPAHQLLPRRRTQRRHSTVFGAGICRHAVTHIGAGDGPSVVGAFEGDAALAGHSRDEGRHLHHTVLYQRCRRVTLRRMPEHPELHPLPLVGGSHPQPINTAVLVVAKPQHILITRCFYRAGRRKRKLVFYH